MRCINIRDKCLNTCFFRRCGICKYRGPKLFMQGIAWCISRSMVDISFQCLHLDENSPYDFTPLPFSGQNKLILNFRLKCGIMCCYSSAAHCTCGNGARMSILLHHHFFTTSCLSPNCPNFFVSTCRYIGFQMLSLLRVTRYTPELCTFVGLLE